MSFPKDGSLICEPWLAFVRRLPCSFCGIGGAQAHHYPPRGRGVTDDSKTCPACPQCHSRCHGTKVNGKPPIAETEQVIAVERTRGLFIEEANDFEWAAYCAARKRHRESRVFMEIPA